ncbi:MAG: prolipoprotein diacylglyceryl transferase [Clostridia bacterium]|nr:prolipoprotein diacylglyceryl transferase [Clostridia bacterium]
MEHIFQIAFPGLGIGEFTLNKVAFTLFGLEVRWYGVIITCGIILAYLYAAWRGRGEGINTDDLLDIAMFAVIFGIIGARLYYVLMRLDDFDSLKEVFNIRGGGLAIYGGVIAGVITLIIASRIKKIHLYRLLDCAAPGVMLAQSIGRWGNFFNGEAFGEQTDIFCRMGLKLSGWSQMYYFHPTFLYESLWNLLGFALINLIYRKKKFDGQIALLYFVWYGLGRMFIEGLRTDSLYLGSFRISQVVAAVSCVICAVLLIVGLSRAQKRKLAEGDYAVVYGRLQSMPIEENAYTETAENETDNMISENKQKSEENENGKVD